MANTKIKLGRKTYNTAELEVPEDRSFRAAWKLDEGESVITIDMIKARDIWRTKIRQARLEAFEALDAAFMMALERGEDIQPIAVKRQALRDATKDPRIDAATSPEELKMVQPAGLKIK